MSSTNVHNNAIYRYRLIQAMGTVFTPHVSSEYFAMHAELKITEVNWINMLPVRTWFFNDDLVQSTLHDMAIWDQQKFYIHAHVSCVLHVVEYM
jgi:hypothetical protein